MARYINIASLSFHSSCLADRINCYDYCPDCPYWGVYFDALDGLDPWIPCGDELPSDDNCYIVAWRPIGKDIGFKHYDAILQFDPEENCFADNDVIARMRKNWAIEFLAWMPLPDDYEGD